MRGVILYARETRDLMPRQFSSLKIVPMYLCEVTEILFLYRYFIHIRSTSTFQIFLLPRYYRIIYTTSKINLNIFRYKIISHVCCKRAVGGKKLKRRYSCIRKWKQKEEGGGVNYTVLLWPSLQRDIRVYVNYLDIFHITYVSLLPRIFL